MIGHHANKFHPERIDIIFTIHEFLQFKSNWGKNIRLQLYRLKISLTDNMNSGHVDTFVCP